MVNSRPTLYAHQKAGSDFLLRNRAAMLAWEMGVGKTAAAIAAYDELSEGANMVVLCPASAKLNWQREIERFASRYLMVGVAEGMKGAGLPPALRGGTVAITNYDLLKYEAVRKRLMILLGGNGVLVCDEAHALKNPSAKRTAAVYGAFSRRPQKLPGLVEAAERVWLLTGTPLPNHPGELWTHYYRLWGNVMPWRGRPMEAWEWQARYCNTIETVWGPKIVGAKNLVELREGLSGVISRLKRKDVLDLPPLMVDYFPIEIGAKELRAVLDAEASAGLDHENVNDLLDARAGSLAELRRLTGTAKIESTTRLIRDTLDAGSGKILVFAHHRVVIDALASNLADHQPAVLHGGTPGAARQREIDRFQSDADCKIFIGQLQAAGSAINLQAAEQVMFVEASWTPGENEQALSRAYRAGQTKPVLVRFLSIPGSVDEAVQRVLARKAAMIAEAID